MTKLTQSMVRNALLAGAEKYAKADFETYVAQLHTELLEQLGQQAAVPRLSDKRTPVDLIRLVARDINRWSQHQTSAETLLQAADEIEQAAAPGVGQMREALQEARVHVVNYSGHNYYKKAIAVLDLIDAALAVAPPPVGSKSKSRSLRITTSDCTQPVVPKGNPGNRGERGTVLLDVERVADALSPYLHDMIEPKARLDAARAAIAALSTPPVGGGK